MFYNVSSQTILYNNKSKNQVKISVFDSHVLFSVVHCMLPSPGLHVFVTLSGLQSSSQLPVKVTIYSIILAGYTAGLHVSHSINKMAKRPTTQTINLLPKGLGLHVHVLVQGSYPFSETNFQDFSRTQTDFSRTLKFTFS